MKYCSKCKRIYPDNVTVCPDELCYNHGLSLALLELSVEAKCQCGNTENLKYHPGWTSGSLNFEAYCRCDACDKKLHDEIDLREKSLYLVVVDGDSCELCRGEKEVKEYIERVIDDSDCEFDPTKSDLFIALRLKEIEPLTKEFRSRAGFVVWDGTLYRVEEIIEPTVDVDRDIFIMM